MEVAPALAVEAMICWSASGLRLARSSERLLVPSGGVGAEAAGGGGGGGGGTAAGATTGGGGIRSSSRGLGMIKTPRITSFVRSSGRMNRSIKSRNS
jgi:hypothetical protein